MAQQKNKMAQRQANEAKRGIPKWSKKNNLRRCDHLCDLWWARETLLCYKNYEECSRKAAEVNSVGTKRERSASESKLLQKGVNVYVWLEIAIRRTYSR